MELKMRSINACDFKKHLHSCTVVDADVIVPDTKPDIFRILTVKAKADVNERYMRKDKIIFSGNVRFNIIYVGEVDKNRMHNIEYTTPFNFQTDAVGADDQCISMAACCVEKTDFKIRNSRKLTVSASVGFDTMITRQNEISVIEGVDGEECVPVRYADYGFDSVAVCREIELSFSEGFTLPVNPESGFEVCDVDVRVEISEIKTVNNKAVIKGGGVFMTLGAADGEIASYENELSFTEICDLDGINPDMSISSYFNVSNCEYTVAVSGNEVGIEAEFKIRGYICACEHTELSLARDMYDPDYKYEKKEADVIFMQNSGPFYAQTTLKDIASPGDSAAEISEIHFMNAICECTGSEINGANIIAEGIVHTDYIYTDSDNRLSSVGKDIPFKLEIPVNKPVSGDVSVNAAATNYGYTLASSKEIQVRIILKAQASVSGGNKARLLTEFASDVNSPIDKSQQPSIVVCYPSETEELWNMAKKHNTTCEAIAGVNGFTADAPELGAGPVIIPKRKQPMRRAEK